VENTLFCNVNESFEEFLDPDPGEDNFPTFNQFFLIQTQISDKIFMKIQSAPFT